MNTANTSVLPVGGDLLALWEGGSATRLDPRTLQTRGLKTWRADLAGVPFSAHLRVEAEGTIWNFGVNAHSGVLLLYEIGDCAQNKTALSCFDADALADGPVAQATLPYSLPLGLHGVFVAM